MNWRKEHSPFYLYLVAVLISLVALLLFHFRPRVERKPPTPPPVPPPVKIERKPLAPEILARYGQEPVLSLYMEDSGETRWIKMEEYLPGVVAAEVEPTWPLQALAAQAVVSRTLTLFSMIHKVGPRQIHGTDACTSPQHLQAYNERKINDSVRQAVQMTRGQVLAFDGAVIQALYHSCSGGKDGHAGGGVPLAGGPRSLPAERRQSLPNGCPGKREDLEGQYSQIRTAGSGGLGRRSGPDGGDNQEGSLGSQRGTQTGNEDHRRSRIASPLGQ
ncbi:MAG: SpoIID/LytB domain-containing protein [Firmicutes bacterium]|nr:SpoIID/LytB domain-containing protein [Bacillota bacterium]